MDNVFGQDAFDGASQWLTQEVGVQGIGLGSGDLEPRIYMDSFVCPLLVLLYFALLKSPSILSYDKKRCLIWKPCVIEMIETRLRYKYRMEIEARVAGTVDSAAVTILYTRSGEAKHREAENTTEGTFSLYSFLVPRSYPLLPYFVLESWQVPIIVLY